MMHRLRVKMQKIYLGIKEKEKELFMWGGNQNKTKLNRTHQWWGGFRNIDSS